MSAEGELIEQFEQAGGSVEDAVLLDAGQTLGGQL